MFFTVSRRRQIFYISLNNAGNVPLGGQLKNVEVNVETIDELHKYVSKNRVETSLEVFTDEIHTRTFTGILIRILLTSATCAKAYFCQRAE